MHSYLCIICFYGDVYLVTIVTIKVVVIIIKTWHGIGVNSVTRLTTDGSAQQRYLNTVKIIIEAQAFICIMVDAEVGSGRLLEATILEWDKQLCGMIFAQIYIHYIIAKGKPFEMVYQISFK